MLFLSFFLVLYFSLSSFFLFYWAFRNFIFILLLLRSHILHFDCSLPSFFSSQSLYPYLHFPSIYASSFLFRLGQAYQRYQPNITYQVAIRLGISPHLKTGWSNPVRERGSQKQPQESDTVHTLPLIRVPQEV